MMATKGFLLQLEKPNAYDEIYGMYTKALKMNGDKTDPFTLQTIAQYSNYMGLIGRIERKEAEDMTDMVYGIAMKNSSIPTYESAAATIDAIKGQYVEQYKLLEEQEAAKAEQAATAATQNVYSEMLDAANAGNFPLAKQKYDEYMPTIDDMERKFGIAMYMGQTLYGADNFPSAREYFRDATRFDSTSGEPMYFIGLMYLSSGPKCGPGTGFDSQRVLYVAFDKFRQAKGMTISADTSADIDAKMAEYGAYLPRLDQLQKQNLKVGDTYTVTCWINEATVIRMEP